MKIRIYAFRSLQHPKGTGSDLGDPYIYFPGAPAGVLGNLSEGGGTNRRDLGGDHERAPKEEGTVPDF